MAVWCLHSGSANSAPSQISRVFAELDRLDPRSRFSIFWDPLPCHLQNGADITDYIIHYSLVTDGPGEARTISTANNQSVTCSQEPIGPYKCYMSSLFFTNERYTFQVAARNSFGVGPFSVPVTATAAATLHSQGTV